MSAQEKILTANNVNNKNDYEKLTTLATKILNGIKTSKQLQSALDSSKKTLNHLCTEIFQEDLKNGEIYGNHTIETSQGKLTVNFRMSPESDISAYENILRAEFKEDYVELFREIASIEVTTAYPNQKSQFSEHPELFTLTLKKNITMGDMVKVFKKYPDLFEIAIRDKERYADVYPNSVKIEKKVYPNHSFIDKLEKFSDVLRKRVINILSKFFDKNMECAVKA
jgi:hypothetical protein